MSNVMRIAAIFCEPCGYRNPTPGLAVPRGFDAAVTIPCARCGDRLTTYPDRGDVLDPEETKARILFSQVMHTDP